MTGARTGTGKRILLGRIAGAHGIRGDVLITAFTERPEDIAAYGPLGLAISGVAVAVLAGALLLALTSTRARARSPAVSMTAELRSVTDTATDAIVTVDHAGHVTAWNRGAARMFGMDPGAILGAPLDRVIPGGLPALTASTACFVAW